MKRVSLVLVMLLALFVVACSNDQESPSPSEPGSTATATAEPSMDATPEPSEPSESSDPASSDDGAGGDTALADLLPEELDGRSRTEIEGFDAMLAPLLAQSGVDASNVDFTFASYGEGTDAVYVQGFRIPGMSDIQLEMLARAMSGSQAGGEIEAETATIGGKDVLRMGGADAPDAAYLYFSDGAVFTVVSESEELATQLLGQLP